MAEPERRLTDQDLIKIKQDWFLADNFEQQTKQDAVLVIKSLLDEIRYYNYWNEKYKTRLTELGE